MSIRGTLLLILIAGCTGEDEPRTIPVYEEGVVTVGDCDESQFVNTDGIALNSLYKIEKSYDEFLQIDGDLPGEAGTVVTKARDWDDLLTELNFDTVSRPILDFATLQAGAVWFEARKSCGLEIEGVHIRTKADGSAVFDVSLLDLRKNCDDNCDTPSQALVIDYFTNEVEATVCRRVRPGCTPN